jgi:hypothetical protein
MFNQYNFKYIFIKIYLLEFFKFSKKYKAKEIFIQKSQLNKKYFDDNTILLLLYKRVQIIC